MDYFPSGEVYELYKVGLSYSMKGFGSGRQGIGRKKNW